MKHFKHFKTIATTFAMSLMLALSGTTALAANDDPGAGRLSGKYISEDFYDTDSISHYGLSRYGVFSTQNLFTNSIYNHQDIFATRTILNGIDVSHWNGDINWTAVKASGIDYAFIQVGYRGYGSSGTLNESTKDPKFDINMQNAIANGVQVGVYVFSQAITPAEAVEEADFILSHIGSYNVTMPLVMDFEYADTASGVGGRLKNANLTRQQATDICIAFCNRIAEAGYTPMVYANKSMLADQLNAAEITNLGYRIWLANYTNETTYNGVFDFWQYSSTGVVPGINGKTDMNFYYAQETDSFTPNGLLIRDAITNIVEDQVYTGIPITPAVSVSYNGVPLIEGTDYIVTYRNNISVGEASIIIMGRGQYTGVKTLNFKIAAPVKMTKHNATSITISWTKLADVTGYQVYRATSKNGTYKKIATIKKKSKTTYKDTNLKSGKAYYYKVRGYIKSGKKKQYREFTPPVEANTSNTYSRYAYPHSVNRLIDGQMLTIQAGIYASPDWNDTIIAYPTEGAPIKILYETKDTSGSKWYYLSYSDFTGTYNGYMPASEITIEMIGKVVKTKKVNVRKSPKITGKLITTLKKKTKVTVTKMKVFKGITWYHVSFEKNGEDYTGWIASPYIKLQ